MYLKQSLDTERILLNKPATPPRPDYVFLDHAGNFVGISRKQAGEFVGGIDATEKQLLEEMAGVTYLGLLIEGFYSPNPDSGIDIWRRKGNMMFRARTLHQSYMGIQQKLARFTDLGVAIIPTADEYATAMALVALHNEMQKPESEATTFKRLIREKHMLSEDDKRKRSFALTLMGIEGGGMGEELALAIATEYEHLASLWEDLVGNPELLAKLPLRSGKRTIGPAAVAKLRGALGVTG